MFKVRTQPVEYGTNPYQWDIPSVYQCVWFGYYRAIECGMTPPCWWDRETKTGSYTNAKEWLKNYRDPWQVKGVDYTPKAGDIAVFDGEYGHIQFLETDSMFSEYSNGDPNSFRNGKFEKKANLLGFLHFPYEAVPTVERNPKVNQVETTDDSLRIRTAPSLDAEVVGYVELGFYNVLATKKADNYTWYKIAADRWIADVTVKYLPKDDDEDIYREIERCFEQLKSNVKEITEEKEVLEEKLYRIGEIVNE